MKLRRRIVLLSVISLLGGCSGEQQAEEPVVEDASGAEEAAEPPADEPTDELEPPTDMEEPQAALPAPAPMADPAPAEAAGFNGAPVVRYVVTYAVHVRSAPDKTASIVRYVKWGDKLDVVVNGEWAKLASGEYVSTKALSESAPRGKSPIGKGKAKTAPKKKK